MNPFPDRLRVQAEVVLDGRRFAATVVIEDDVWASDEGRREVIARLKAYLVEQLLTELNPVIRISR